MLDKTAAFLEMLDGVHGVVRARPAVPDSGRDGEGPQFFELGTRVDPLSQTDIDLHTKAKEEVELLRSLPECVLLAGSSRFKQAFEDEAYRMALRGVIVLGKHVFKPGAEWPVTERERDMIHVVQFRMCDLASRVHVVNVDGYIGQDTYNLIRCAMRKELPITFLEDKVRLRSNGELVTAAHFLRATKQSVEFSQAALG